MKTILIPTDFDQLSVHQSKVILGKAGNELVMTSYITDQGQTFKHEKVRIIFFHAYKLTDSISDLLMLRRRTAEYGQISPEFHEACASLKADYEQAIYSIGIEYFYGSTMAAFRNFVEANEVDAIFYPEDYNFQKISRYSLDPELFLKRSGLPVIKPLELTVPAVEKSRSEEQINKISEMA
ncbi:hypothetical protein ACSBL2_03790 [Pedobacter sp. AW31-3R]|uniref:hypothetical protein n=1 Tax=Pedobacter sp. AW31-3R TaxID=3445781 RepID=UPI003FA02075